jgi:hypothetical protein
MTEISMRSGQPLPSRATIGGFLYVIEFSEGTVKVGSTLAPADRIHSHRVSGEPFGITIVDWWLSGNHADYLDTEQRLIRHVTHFAYSRRARREYFRNISYLKVVALAQRLSRGDHLEPGPRYTRSGEQMYSLKQVEAMTGFFPADYLHRGCWTRRYICEIRDGAYYFTYPRIQALFAQHTQGGSAPWPVFATHRRPTQSLRHRRAARERMAAA